MIQIPYLQPRKLHSFCLLTPSLKETRFRAMADSKMKLKLLVDRKARKVLFAEANKDFVDFLFYLLSLPIGTVIRALKGNTVENSALGSFGNLYESIENLSETYILPHQGKDTVLNPRSPICATEMPPLLSFTDNESTDTRKAYRCRYHDTVADVPGTPFSVCRERMTIEMSRVAATVDDIEGGFVKGVVTYMVMDNLEVKPMSTISSITLLNKFNIKEVGVLEEKVVDLGIDEALKLLKTSLESKSVLTSIFLGSDVPVPVSFSARANIPPPM